VVPAGYVTLAAPSALLSETAPAAPTTSTYSPSTMLLTLLAFPSVRLVFGSTTPFVSDVLQIANLATVLQITNV
jgi:hypothetical protein